MAAAKQDPVNRAGRVLTVRQSLLAMLGICFVVMMVAIDQTVVGTALPTIAAELNGFEFYAWVATAYLLMSVITIPIFGRLGDYYGRKPFVIASIIIFTSASALCGTADSMEQVVLARALQGIGGGMLIGTAFASVPDLFPDTHARFRWQILLSSAFGVANAFGPTLGGFMTQYLGWRAVFFINVPLGLMSLYCVWRFLPRIRQMQGQPIRLDWVGALLLVCVLTAMQLAVQLAPIRGAGLAAILMAMGVLLLLPALVYWERRSGQPLLPPDMFRNKALTAMFVLALCLGFVMFGLLFYIPLLLQGGFGLDPRSVGLLITPMVVCITLGSIINGRVVVRLSRPNHMLYVGFVLLVVACLGFVLMDRDTSRWLMLLWMVLAGSGMGCLMPNLTVFAQETAGRTLLGISTALMHSVRMIGGMLGTAIIGMLVSHHYVSSVRARFAQDAGTAWLANLEDPQTLMNSATQAEFSLQVQKLGLTSGGLIEQARESLVSAVHLGLASALVVACLGMVLVYRVPAIRLSRRQSTEPGAPTSERKA
ncbi:MFS transporter [Parapusillimonas sp. JC17]|uniref:MFS transporter n=1 Tax=Parapusillimonas sp. JC17 TaxID=3445768 RepID=UPI003F9EF286